MVQIEKAIHYGEFVIGVFAEVWRAFNNVSIEVLLQGLISRKPERRPTITVDETLRTSFNA